MGSERSSERRSAVARRAVVAAALLLAAAQAEAADLKIGRRFQSWTGGCERAPVGRGRACFIFQKLSLPETGRELASIAVGYPVKGEPPMAVLKVPLGTLLPAGITLTIEDGAPRSFPIQFCTEEGCRAHVPLTPDMLAGLKAGLKAELSFQDLERRIVTLSISLRGFTRGLASLR